MVVQVNHTNKWLYRQSSFICVQQNQNKCRNQNHPHPVDSAFSSEDPISWHVGTLFEDPCLLLSPTIQYEK